MRELFPGGSSDSDRCSKSIKAAVAGIVRERCAVTTIFKALAMGMLLTTPMIFIGAGFMIYAYARRQPSGNQIL